MTTVDDPDQQPSLALDLTELEALSRVDPDAAVEQLRHVQAQLTAFRLRYKFAIDEIQTKISILREEFEQTHDYSPIEHVRTRLKSMDSLVAKVERTGCEPTLDAIAENIRDIAGVRITCAFVEDCYWIADLLTGQRDVETVQVKDYITDPKPNGYQSLHLIVRIPVFLSDRTDLVPVEVQIRTIAMDFWASLEHKIYYKYGREVPRHLLDELRQAAGAAQHLDRTMARLRDEVNALANGSAAEGVAITPPSV